MVPLEANLATPKVLPTLGLVISALISGFYWLPLRHLQNLGFQGIFAAAIIAVLAALPLVRPLLRHRSGTDWYDLARIGILVGGGYALYSASLVLTDVARAVLLFYLAPVWTTVLEIFVLSQKLTAKRLASIILGFGGLVALLARESDGDALGSGVNTGDVFALMAGVIWSFGLLIIYRRKDLKTSEQLAAQAGGAVVVALLVLPLGWADSHPLAPDALLAAVPWFLVIAFLLTMPMWGFSLWATRYIPPARASIIFMMEVCIGVASTAILSGYQLHWNEYLGTTLVLAAAGLELIKAKA
jgi:drug/metabolite transporter (DMT)-like permease